MTSRERVRGALRRTPIDQLPIFMWFHPATASRLSAECADPLSTIAHLPGNDVAQTWVGNNAAMEGVVHEHDGDSHTDVWGITWVKEGPFNQVLHSPLATADEAACRAYTFPHHAIPALVALMDSTAGNDNELFIGGDVSPCLFELLCRLQGMERATADLAADPLTTSMLLERAADFGVELARAVCTRYPLDWLWTGDDVAGQQSMIMSPSAWRKMIKPQLARIVAVGKEHNLPVAYHCCGAVRPIIPDLIEMGVDVLNPVQTTCPGMDPVELKREYGKHLTFMGGIDTVSLLPHGSPTEVYEATRRLIDILGRDGGYILSASHTVPPETPIDNILAMYRAAGRTFFPGKNILQKD